MDENDEDNKASSSLFSNRYRSPTFQQAEVKLLVQLIEKYKHHILNKSTNSLANHAKEKTWEKIAKEFNKQGVGLERSMDVLKTKWDNLKRFARKIARDVLDEDCEKDEINKTVMMICAADNGLVCNGNEFNEEKDDDDFENERGQFKHWIDLSNADNEPVLFVIDDENQNKTPNNKKSPCEVPRGFSPRDCKVLLQCVRREKNVLFSNTSMMQRHKAWQRIAETYNKQSPRKRTPTELNKKFNNMKSVAKKVNFKHYFKGVKRKKYDRLSDDIEQVTPMKQIKSEPIINCTADYDFDSDDDDQGPKIDLNNTTNSRLSFSQDPLNNVHNSDSGLGSMSENKDVARLKLELLNYNMDTARLERKRLEELMKAEEKDREIRALEHSLRLRAARLEVVAAESKLPLTHPALKYTVEERRAQQYLSNAQLDLG